MRGLLLLANGFEDVEAIATRDILIRGGVEVDLVSIYRSHKEVTSSHHLNVIANKTYDEIDLKDYDFIILPGGGLGVKNLLQSNEVEEAVKYFMSKHMLVAAICAVPMVLGKYGYLKDKKFTCYQGCEVGINGIYTGNEVEIVDNIITARSMKYSVLFGLTILEKLLGKEIANKVKKAIEGR